MSKNQRGFQITYLLVNIFMCHSVRHTPQNNYFFAKLYYTKLRLISPKIKTNPIGIYFQICFYFVIAKRVMSLKVYWT